MTSTAPDTDRPTRRRWWLEAAGVGALVLADFGAFAWMLADRIDRFQHAHDDVGRNVHFFLESDLGQPLLVGVWCLMVANGLVLCVLRRTRQAGIGVLMAALGIGVAVVLWASWAIMTFASG